MKNLLLAIVIGVLLINGLGYLLDCVLGIDIVIDNHHFNWVENMAMLTFVAMVLVAVGFIVTISVIGGVLFAVGAAFTALLFAGVGVLWPFILIVVICMLVKKRNKQSDKHYYHVQ